MKKNTLFIVATLIALLVFLKISKAQTYTISTAAGTGTAGYSGDGGQATAAKLNTPMGEWMDGSGNIYVVDAANNRVRKITTGGIITTIAGTGSAGYSGNGGQATAAKIQNADGVAIDGLGNIYIADQGNNVVRMINTNGVISLFAGIPASYGYTGDGGQATAAKLFQPGGLSVDASNNLYIVDEANNVVRKVTTAGVISTVVGNGYNAGTGNGGFSGDGGQATAAELNFPYDMTIDASGNMYIADNSNNRIRKVTTAGVISTLASINQPTGIAVDAFGNLFVSSASVVKVARISPAGAITYIAGNGTQGYTGDGGAATAAEINTPYGIGVDGSGNVYFADQSDNVVRKLSPIPATPGTITGTTTVCQGSSQTYSISAVTYATSYTWTLPSDWSGTSTGTSITVTVGATSGNVSVTANNANGSSSAKTLAITVNATPSITTQPFPFALSACTGSPGPLLNVIATGAGLSYQWYSNALNSNSGGTLINGATSSAYATPTTTLGTQYYYCVVSGTCTPAATSFPSGPVTVYSTPSITVQPSTATQTGCLGFSATTLSVTATGSGLTYQWFSNTTNSNTTGSPIGGATSSSYTPVTTSSGVLYYYCMVTGAGSCSVTSNVSGAITVNAPPSIVGDPALTAQSGCPGFSATAYAVLANGTGLTYQWYSNAANSNSGGTLISGATSTSYTPVTTTPGTLYYYCVVSGTCSPAEASNPSGAVTVYDPPIVTVQPSTATQSGCPGFSASSLSITATGLGITYQWYSNTTNSNAGGTLISGATSSSYTPVTTTPGTLYYYCIVSGTCSPTAKSNVSGAVTVNSLPAITVQPSTSAQTGCQGFSASPISVTATGTGLTYQWYSNATNSNSGGTILAGATSGSYTPVTTVAGTLYYYCVVSGTCTPAVTSNVSGSVTVNFAPAITVQPSVATQTGCVGFSASAFSITASGTGITYQWYSNTTNSNSGGNSISGATSSSYIPVTTSTGVLYYYCVVSGTCSPAVTSNVSGSVTVNGLPNITVQPSTAAQTGCLGFSAIPLSVTATGAGLTYQWYKNISNTNSGGASISGATSSSYTPVTSSTGTLYYYCIVTGTCSPPVSSNVSGAITTNPGTPAAPVAITGASSQCSAITGQVYSISPVANATTYTWSVPSGWAITAGAGTASITVTAGIFGQNGIITVTAGNSCGTSAAATLAVAVNPLPSIDISGNIINGFAVCAGNADTLTATASGGSGAGYTYIWNDGNTTATELETATGTYTVTVTDGNGCVNSASQSVLVNSLPVVNVSASANTICAGTADTITAASVTLNENGLVAYYPFNGNTNDESGNGYNATPNGVTLATDRFGKPNSCYRFNGQNTYVQCPNGTYFTGDFTVSGWVMADTLQNYCRLTDFGNGSANSNVITILSVASSGDLGLAVYNGSGSTSGNQDDNTPIPLNQWGQAVFTLQGNTYSIYYNGVLMTSGSIAITPNNTVRTECYIGKSDWPGDGGLYGYMDDIRIYNRALSSNEVASLYTNESISETAYSWSTGSGNDSIIVSPTVTQTFTLSVTNEDGCAGTASQTIKVNALPAVGVTSTPANGNVCTGSNITLAGNGASTYSWSGGIINDTAFSPSSTATYTVTGTDSNNCVNTATQVVTVNSLPTIAVVATPGNATVCAGSNVTLAGNGAVSYSWTGGITDNIPFSASNTTTYTVTGTDANNCSNTATQLITVNQLPTVTVLATPTTATVCSGGIITLAGSGAATYSWSGGITNDSTFTPVFTTTYTVTGTDGNNCSNTATQLVTVNLPPNVLLNMGSLTNECTGGPTVTLSGGSPVGGIYNGTDVSAGQFYPSTTGTYPVTYVYTDANGCVDSASQNIDVSICTGISSIGRANEFAIYPSPNNGHFTVSLGEDSYRVLTIDDETGKEIYRQALAKNKAVISVDLSTFADGIYFAQVITSHGVLNKKIVIQK